MSLSLSMSWLAQQFMGFYQIREGCWDSHIPVHPCANPNRHLIPQHVCIALCLAAQQRMSASVQHRMRACHTDMLSERIALPNFFYLQYLSLCFQGELLGLLLVPMFFKLTLQLWGYCRNMSTPRKIESTALFYTSAIVMLTFLMPAWMNFVHKFGVHPLLWWAFF